MFRWRTEECNVGQLFELSGGGGGGNLIPLLLIRIYWTHVIFFVLLCHMLGMSSIIVKFSGLLYIHARFQRGRVRTHGSQYYRVP